MLRLLKRRRWRFPRQSGLPHLTVLEFLRTPPLVPRAHLSSGPTCLSAFAAQKSLAAGSFPNAFAAYKLVPCRQIPRWRCPVLAHADPTGIRLLSSSSTLVAVNRFDCPASPRKRRPKRARIAPPHRLSRPCVSDVLRCIRPKTGNEP